VAECYLSCVFLQNRGDELVQPLEQQKEQQNLSVGDGAAHTNAGTGGSAVASLATDNARTRAVDEAESANSLRQPASLQVGNICCFENCHLVSACVHVGFFLAIRLLCNDAFISGLILQQLPGQIDAFGVEALGQRSQQPEGYAALNEQLLSQLTYQLADSDKKVCIRSCVTT
jgi:hypothetical protein